LDLAVGAGILAGFLALQSGRARTLLCAAAACGFGLLAKGPVAPVCVLLVLIPYAAWQSRYGSMRWPSWRAWIGAAAIFVAIVLPWFAALVARSGMPAVVELIGHYTVGRYTGTIENQRGPFWYYIPVFVLGFFPWVAYFPSAIAHALTQLRRRDAEARVRPWLRLALCWLVLPVLFFSFAQTKLPNYIALELPAPALLVALYLDAAVERARSRSALFSSAIVPLFILLLAIAIVWFSRDNRLTGAFNQLAFNLIYVGAAIFLGAFVAFFLLLAPRIRVRSWAPYALGVSMLFALAFIALLALPQTEAFKPVPHLAKIINAGRKPGDAVAILHVSGGNALVFYTHPRVFVLVGPHDPNPGGLGVSPRTVICSAPRTWLIAPLRTPPPTFGHGRQLVTSWDKAALYLYDGRPCVDSGRRGLHA
jgi:4-amino-4-deoxy-L-arabinose transferase-like glycosyltransferase